MCVRGSVSRSKLNFTVITTTPSTANAMTTSATWWSVAARRGHNLTSVCTRRLDSVTLILTLILTLTLTQFGLCGMPRIESRARVAGSLRTHVQPMVEAWSVTGFG